MAYFFFNLTAAGNQEALLQNLFNRYPKKLHGPYAALKGAGMGGHLDLIRKLLKLPSVIVSVGAGYATDGAARGGHRDLLHKLIGISLQAPSVLKHRR